jgi:acetylornithine deacetylase/succinyl-diaminopimelate desuccinylase-like protein
MSEDVAAIMQSAFYRNAVAVLDREHDRIVEDIVRLTEIPSPPFGEDVRGDAYLALLQQHGLAEVEKDAVGNVMGLRRGVGNGELIVVAAHLDTVFPAGTDVTVRREGTKLFAPGIGDDTRSLAVLLGFMRAMDEAGIRTRSDILFVGDVGEEGLGDLRGVRHLFHEGKYKDRIKAFFTVDSPEMDSIVTAGVGSKRYRVMFRGPGGHSYGAFGLVSPMNAMAQAIGELARVQVPAQPKTTYSVSVVGGGTSVNAIPNEVWMEVDLRSAAPVELARLEARFHAVIEQAVDGENHARSIAQGPITFEAVVIGDRPAGSTSADSDIVRHATAAVEAHGFKTRRVASSTDANIPMALGIPAIKIGSGGSAGRAHSLEEWIDVDKEPSLRGMAATLTAILAVAGMAD